MKTMNHVPSTQDGTVSKILVKDGEACRIWSNHLFQLNDVQKKS